MLVDATATAFHKQRHARGGVGDKDDVDDNNAGGSCLVREGRDAVAAK